MEEELNSVVPISANQASFTKAGRSHAESGLKSAERRLSIAEEIDRATYKYIILKDKIISQIEGLPDAWQAELLYLRYVRFLSFDEIARAMHKEYNYVSRLHGRALEAFDLLHGTEIQ